MFRQDAELLDVSKKLKPEDVRIVVDPIENNSV